MLAEDLGLKAVCLPRILEVGAESRRLAQDPGDRRSTTFAGGGSQSLAEDALDLRCRLLAEDPEGWCYGFAGRGFSRLALDVFCWPRILEVVAARRLLVEDLGSWR